MTEKTYFPSGNDPTNLNFTKKLFLLSDQDKVGLL